MKTDLLLAKVGLLLLSTCYAAPCAAQLASVLCDVTDMGAGKYKYAYTVDNTAGSFSIWTWTLEFKVAPDWNQDEVAFGGDVNVPPLWAAYAAGAPGGPPTQAFVSLASADIAAGRSLGTFAFVSSWRPGTVDWYVFGPAGDFQGGTVAGVPEPSGWSLIGLLLCAATAFWHKWSLSSAPGNPARS